MNWSHLFTKLLDPYDLKARLLPGLLVLLPAITFLTLLYGPKNPLTIGLSSVLATCGGPYLLSNFVRTLGLRAQERLYKQWGAQPSTILLRHGDKQVPEQTKRRYHILAFKQLGVDMPSSVEEQENPSRADQAYMAAADTLRPMTNDSKTFPFVFKELIIYGYNRNAYGSRWVGFSVSIATIIATLLHAGALKIERPFMVHSALNASHLLTLIVAIVFALLWCFHFNAKTVQQSGFSYGKRLWETLEMIPKKSSQSLRSRKSKNADPMS